MLICRFSFSTVVPKSLVGVTSYNKDILNIEKDQLSKTHDYGNINILVYKNPA